MGPRFPPLSIPKKAFNERDEDGETKALYSSPAVSPLTSWTTDCSSSQSLPSVQSISSTSSYSSMSRSSGSASYSMYSDSMLLSKTSSSLFSSYDDGDSSENQETDSDSDSDNHVSDCSEKECGSESCSESGSDSEYESDTENESQSDNESGSENGSDSDGSESQASTFDRSDSATFFSANSESCRSSTSHICDEKAEEMNDKEDDCEQEGQLVVSSRELDNLHWQQELLETKLFVRRTTRSLDERAGDDCSSVEGSLAPSRLRWWFEKPKENDETTSELNNRSSIFWFLDGGLCGANLSGVDTSAKDDIKNEIIESHSNEIKCNGTMNSNINGTKQRQGMAKCEEKIDNDIVGTVLKDSVKSYVTSLYGGCEAEPTLSNDFVEDETAFQVVPLTTKPNMDRRYQPESIGYQKSSSFEIDDESYLRAVVNDGDQRDCVVVSSANLSDNSSLLTSKRRNIMDSPCRRDLKIVDHNITLPNVSDKVVNDQMVIRSYPSDEQQDS